MTSWLLWFAPYFQGILESMATQNMYHQHLFAVIWILPVIVAFLWHVTLPKSWAVIFYRVNLFCTFWPQNQIMFFFGTFCHWNCHDECVTILLVLKTMKTNEAQIGKIHIIAANCTFEIKIVRNFLLSLVCLYLSMWWCCKFLFGWSSTPGKVKKFIYKFGVLMRHVIEQWLSYATCSLM